MWNSVFRKGLQTVEPARAFLHFEACVAQANALRKLAWIRARR